MTIKDNLAEVRKRNDRKKNEYARGIGGATATAGLIAGGIPGETSDSSKFDMHDIRRAHRRPKAALTSLKGGILGYRIDAHQAHLDHLRDEETKYKGKPTEIYNHFSRGVGDGGIGPEKKIIGHLKRGRIAANAALIGGTGAVLVANRNLNKPKSRVSKAAKKQRYNAQVAGGATLAAGSVAGGSLLDRQGNKWAKRAADSYDEAKKIIPEMGGWTNARSDHRVRHVKPQLSDDYIRDNHASTLAGHTVEDVEAAGKHRGAAAKARYFATTYGSNAKYIRRIGVPVGVAGMALGNKKVQRYTDKKRIALAERITPNDIKKGFTTPVGRKLVLKPVGRVRGWADQEVGFVKAPTVAVNSKGEAKVVARRKRDGETMALGGSFERARSSGSPYDAFEVKVSPSFDNATVHVKKTLYLNTEHMKEVDAQARKNVGHIPKNAPVNSNGYPIVLDKEVRRINKKRLKRI